MEKILVDKLVVPKESKDAFLERTRQVQGFLKTLPGFVEGFLYENKDGESRYNYMTIAVWKSEDAFENAKKSVGIEFQKQGFDPQEMRRKLKIEGERAVYERSAY